MASRHERIQLETREIFDLQFRQRDSTFRSSLRPKRLFFGHNEHPIGCGMEPRRVIGRDFGQVVRYRSVSSGRRNGRIESDQ